MAAPTVHFYQFSSSGVNPAGSRHLKTHGSFVKELNTAASGILDMGSFDVSTITNTPTKAMVFRVSNLGGNSKVQNMRFWAPTLPAPVGGISYNFKAMTVYHSGIALTPSSGTVPTSLPDSGNVLCTDGNNYIDGVVDADVSQWIYLNVTVNSSTTTGRYGGNSTYKYRMTYDYL